MLVQAYFLVYFWMVQRKKNILWEFQNDTGVHDGNGNSELYWFTHFISQPFEEAETIESNHLQFFKAKYSARPEHIYFYVVCLQLNYLRHAGSTSKNI